ncbi:MAG: HEAT repeat domain-containing protein, partial [Phycisphaerae bacterium]
GQLSQGNQNRAYFVLIALSRLETDVAAEALLDALAASTPHLRQAALEGLVNMRAHPLISGTAGIARIAAATRDASTEVRIVACAALGQIAAPHDLTAIAALSEQLNADRDVRWNAALALARLRSERGTPLMLSMLDRGYWTSDANQVEYVTPKGDAVRRPFSDRQIRDYLMAAIDAAAGLTDPAVRTAISKLQSDPSMAVRDRAIKAVKTVSNEPRAMVRMRSVPGESV